MQSTAARKPRLLLGCGYGIDVSAQDGSTRVSMELNADGVEFCGSARREMLRNRMNWNIDREEDAS